MSKFEIVTDTTCDLPESFQKQYDIHIIPGHIILPDKGDIPAFLKWEQFSREQFYAELKKNPNDFSTSPPNVAEYTDAFETLVKQKKDILCVTISSGISGAFGFAEAAKKSVVQKYPGANIKIVDTMRFGPAIGLMAVYAAKLRDAGRTLDETVEYLEDKKNSLHQAGWLDDLSFVAKKGRITHAKAFFGSLAGVKPIGEFDYNGLTTVIGKVKGAKTAFSVLIKYMEKTITDPSDQIIFIAQTNRLKEAEIYKSMIEERFHPKEIYIHDVFPACGINIGPGLMAAYYMGTPISPDLSSERAIVENAIIEETKK